MIVIKKELDEIDKKIVRLSANGKSSKEIAYELNISVHVINMKICAMMKYFKCNTRVQLISMLHTKNRSKHS